MGGADFLLLLGEELPRKSKTKNDVALCFGPDGDREVSSCLESGRLMTEIPESGCKAEERGQRRDFIFNYKSDLFGC